MAGYIIQRCWNFAVWHKNRIATIVLCILSLIDSRSYFNVVLILMWQLHQKVTEFVPLDLLHVTHESRPTIHTYRADQRGEARVERVQPNMGFESADKERRDVKNSRTWLVGLFQYQLTYVQSLPASKTQRTVLNWHMWLFSPEFERC